MSLNFIVTKAEGTVFSQNCWMILIYFCLYPSMRGQKPSTTLERKTIDSFTGTSRLVVFILNILIFSLIIIKNIWKYIFEFLIFRSTVFLLLLGYNHLYCNDITIKEVVFCVYLVIVCKERPWYLIRAFYISIRFRHTTQPFRQSM